MTTVETVSGTVRHVPGVVVPLGPPTRGVVRPNSSGKVTVLLLSTDIRTGLVVNEVGQKEIVSYKNVFRVPRGSQDVVPKPWETSPTRADAKVTTGLTGVYLTASQTP